MRYSYQRARHAHLISRPCTVCNGAGSQKKLKVLLDFGISEFNTLEGDG